MKRLLSWQIIIVIIVWISCVIALILYGAIGEQKGMIKPVMASLILCIGVLSGVIIYLQDKLSKRLIKDELTGLYNKNYLSTCKYRETAMADRHQVKLGLMLIEIHDLKKLKKNYGKRAVKRVIKQVASVLSKSSRIGEVLFYMENGRYLIFYNDMKEYSNIKLIKERLQKKFEEPVHIRGHLVKVVLEFGFGVYPDDGDTFETVLNVTEQRIYLEKKR